MADAVTLARAIIEVGAQGIPDTQAAIAKLEAKLATLGTTYKAGKMSIVEYAAESARLRGQIGELEAGLAGAEALIKKHGSAQAAAVAVTKQSRAGARDYGQAIMSASFALQDFMSANGDMVQGLYRIQNNIPGVLMMLGASGGLAGAVSMASLGLGLFLPKILEVVKGLGLFEGAAEGAGRGIAALEARIKELEAKPTKLAVDVFELDQARKQLKELEEAKKAFERMSAGGSPEEKASGAAVAGALTSLPAAENDDVMRGLKANMAAELDKTSKTVLGVDQKKADAEATLKGIIEAMNREGNTAEDVAMLGKQIDKAEAAVRQAEQDAARVRQEIRATGGEAEQELGKLFAKAAEGDVEAQKTLAGRLRGIGREDLAKKVEESSPAAIQAKKEAEEQAGYEQKGREHLRLFRQQQRLKDDREAERMARSLEPSVGKELLRPGGISDEDLEGRVRKAMEKAGVAADVIDRTLTSTAAKLREDMESKVRARALERGIGEGEAATQLRDEAAEREKKMADRDRPKAEVMSTEAYLDKLLVAGLNKADDTPKQQLAEQQKTNEKLDEAIQAVKESRASPGPAMFARGRRG